MNINLPIVRLLPIFAPFICQVVFAQSSGAPTCTLADATRNCQVFSGPDSIVEFPDGTSIAAGPRAFLSESDRSRLRTEDLYGSSVSEVLDGVPSARLGESARMWLLSDQAAYDLRGLSDWRNKDLPGTLRIPWPLGVADAQIQAVPIEEALRALDGALGRANFDRVLGGARSQAELHGELDERGRDRHLDVVEQTYQSNVVRVNNLVRRTMERARQRILRGRSEAQLSEEERNLLERLRTLRVDEDAAGDCAPGAVGAYYNAPMHTFGLCRASYGLPDEALTLLIAHEIGHAIDPCMSRGPLVEVNEARIRERLAARAALGEDKPSEETMLLEQLGTSRGFAQIDPSQAQSEFVRGLIADGTLRVHRNGVPASSHPFRSVIGCLTEERGGGFPGSNWRAAEEGESRFCQRDPLNEAFCDWFGAEVLSESNGVAGHQHRHATQPTPDQARTRALRTFAIYAPPVCFLDPGDPTPENEMTVTNWDGRSHPPSAMRADGIVMRNPSLRSLFGCARSRDHYCSQDGAGSPPRSDGPRSEGEAQGGVR